MKRLCLSLAAFAAVSFSFVWAQAPAEFKGHEGLIHSIAFSSDGSIMATASFDGNVKLWNFASGKESQILKGTSQVTGVAFNKDGTIVATGSADGVIKFWNPKDGKAIKELKAHPAAGAVPGGVGAVAFSPDGNILASGGTDKTVKLLDAKDLKEIKNLGAHKESVYSVAFNADGSQLASTGNDGIIKIWDVKGQKEIKSMMVDLPKPEIKIEPKKIEPKKDEKDKKDVKKKDMGKKEEPKEPRDAFTAVAFTPDGKQVLSVGHDKFLRFWNLADGKEAKKIGPTRDYLFGLSISKDGKYVATAGYGGSLRVYELSSGNKVYDDTDKGNESRKGWITYCAAFTPDGKSVVTGHEKASKGIAKITAISK